MLIDISLFEKYINKFEERLQNKMYDLLLSINL